MFVVSEFYALNHLSNHIIPQPITSLFLITWPIPIAMKRNHYCIWFQLTFSIATGIIFWDTAFENERNAFVSPILNIALWVYSVYSLFSLQYYFIQKISQNSGWCILMAFYHIIVMKEKRQSHYYWIIICEIKISIIIH